MSQNNKYKYEILSTVLNVLANSRFVESNSYPFLLEFHFDIKLFLIISIIILSVSEIIKAIERNIK